MEITYKKLQEISRAVNAIPSQTEEKVFYKDSLAKASQKLAKKLTHHFVDLKEHTEEIHETNCMKNEKGAILYDKEGRHLCTVSDMKIRREQIAELNRKTISIDPVICTDTTRVENLPLWILDTLDGILFHSPAKECSDNHIEEKESCKQI